MEHEIIRGDWYVVDGNQGIEVIPGELATVADMSSETWRPVPEELADYCESGRCLSVERKTGWGARLSMPGYLDCTEWTLHDTEEQARAYLTETYEES